MAGEPTVFVIDDDNAVRESLRALLESAGIDVDTFVSGQEFLESYDPERWGCIVLDVRMPSENGLELQARLRAKRIDLPVILITGHGDIEMAVSAMKAGAVDFIEKPFTDEAILGSIQRAFEIARRALYQDFSSEEVARRIASLTPREREVFDKLVLGLASKVIAQDLKISPRTVEVHRARVMHKMQARNLSHLVRMALSVGLDFDPDH